VFNWISHIMYATTTLGSPLFQILFFTYVGKAYTTLPERFFIVGNAVQVSAMSGIYAATMTIANERRFGTLSPLLATPANRVVLYFLLLLFCGVNVPQEELPGWMQAIGNAMR